ncbi:helix-turn-helix domain-containing protein [Gemmatimonadota bacterium]
MAKDKELSTDPDYGPPPWEWPENAVPENEEELIGWLIYHWRMNELLNQSDLAEKAGLSASDISRYENHFHQPKFKALHQIAKALDVTLSQFFRPISPEPAIPQPSVDSVRRSAVATFFEWVEERFEKSPTELSRDEWHAFIQGILGMYQEKRDDTDNSLPL